MSVDDLGWSVELPRPPQRIVSLVPSITEALAADVPQRLVAATDWCVRPARLAVPRIRGTKNPDLAAIRALEPHLVVANQEENRELDIRRLRAAGVAVWVTKIETVEQALESLDRLYSDGLMIDRPQWLLDARDRWSGPPPSGRGRVAVPIWRDPWMVVGSHTYSDDLLRRLGWENAFSYGRQRYPKVELADIDRPDIDLILLPDEPYVFTSDDGPGAFARVPTRLVSGRLLTWYGPAMVEAHDVFLSSDDEFSARPAFSTRED